MDIIDALLGEHGTLVAQFDVIEKDLPRVDEAAAVRAEARVLASALLSHAGIEDEVLFPTFQGVASDMVEVMRAEHREVHRT